MDIEADIDIDGWNESDPSIPRLEDDQKELIISTRETIRREAYKQLRASHDLTIRELQQAGVLGAMRAAAKFNPERGCQFSTYAAYWIRTEIQRAVEWEGRSIRLPSHIHGNYHKILKTENEAGGKLSIDELHDRTGISKTTLQRTLQAVQSWTDSMEKPKGNKHGEQRRKIEDTIEDANWISPELKIAQEKNIEFLQDMLKELKWDYPRYYEVLVMRFGLNGEPEKTLNEIGEKLKISREKARQLEAKALAKLRAKAKKMRFEAS